MIRRLLIANRGEIAVRIIRTARRMGIQTVAVYSDADARTRHVADADIAIRIGEPPATRSYLNATAILDAAERSHADAIHPGYGFLSENPDFAQSVLDADLAWVGPPPLAMRAVGDKAHAKALAERNDVPVLAGYHGEDQSPATLREAAARVGYPVLIKAAAGGGGRGMRVVDRAEDFDAGLEGAQREAAAAFGDDRVLLERFVLRPRHVEVQILADTFGNFVHLGERECSVQRRHQKLLEESPSPAVDAALRQRMGEAALRLARAAGYTNAGTVEFLLLPSGEFAFLEVNARLQVEHPVTEAVTGLDLVELQLRIASGEALPMSTVALQGHAIEVRVVAEDPIAGWTPSSGTLGHVEFPTFVRTDTWIDDGTAISPYYDSLLAKVISHGDSRDDAIERLAHGLQEVRIDGVADNVDLLLATIEHPAFTSGELHTGFLEEHAIVESTASVPPIVMAAVCSVPPRADEDPWRTPNGWRLSRVDQPGAWARAGREHRARISLDPATGETIVEFEGQSLRARIVHKTPFYLQSRVSVDDQTLTVWDHDDWRVVEYEGRGYRFERPLPVTVDRATHAAGGGGGLVAPMPARVVKIAISVGESVTQNQPLIVLEAMKMEHVVEAPHPGTVKEVCVGVGDQVQSGARLVVLD